MDVMMRENGRYEARSAPVTYAQRGAQVYFDCVAKRGARLKDPLPFTITINHYYFPLPIMGILALSSSVIFCHRSFEMCCLTIFVL